MFFADDGYRTPDVLIEGPSYSIIRRRTLAVWLDMVVGGEVRPVKTKVFVSA